MSTFEKLQKALPFPEEQSPADRAQVGTKPAVAPKDLTTQPSTTDLDQGNEIELRLEVLSDARLYCAEKIDPIAHGQSARHWRHEYWTSQFSKRFNGETYNRAETQPARWNPDVADLCHPGDGLSYLVALQEALQKYDLDPAKIAPAKVGMIAEAVIKIGFDAQLSADKMTRLSKVNRLPVPDLHLHIACAQTCLEVLEDLVQRTEGTPFRAPVVQNFSGVEPTEVSSARDHHLYPSIRDIAELYADGKSAP